MIRDNDYIPWRHGPNAAPWLDTLMVVLDGQFIEKY
jgi:hypothetical protein